MMMMIMGECKLYINKGKSLTTETKCCNAMQDGGVPPRRHRWRTLELH